MATSNLTGADTVLVGPAYRAGANSENRRGVVMTPSRFVNWGAVAAALAEGIIKDATSTELPNNTTTTYTASTDGTGPQDASTRPSKVTINVSGTEYEVLDLTGSALLGRNIAAAVTHGSSVVAMTILVYGFDIYNKPLTELLTITATGTSKTAVGKKAFRYFWKADVISAGNSTTNTLDLGTGSVLGLPYRIDTKNAVVVRVDGANDASATVAVADTNTATTTTGDVRGTVAYNSAPNGTTVHDVIVYILNTATEAAVYGVAQA